MEFEEFKKIVEDIYEQGYICGFGNDRAKWIEIYAKAMLEISKGRKFNDQLIFDCDSDLPTNMNEVH